MFKRVGSYVAGAAVLACCAGPRIHTEYPPASPASLRAEAAPAPPVAPMLRGDPPLPGDEEASWQQWPGLEGVIEDGHDGHGTGRDAREDSTSEEDYAGHGADAQTERAPPGAPAPAEQPEHQHAN